MPSMPEVTARPYSYRDDPAVTLFDDSRALFVFDGTCVMCSSGAKWLMRRDRRARVNFTPSQGLLGRGLYRHYGVNPVESYVLIADGLPVTASRRHPRLGATLGCIR